MKATDFKRKKLKQEKISMLTCYDYPSARIIAQSDIDCILVGDSVAMAVHGHDSTVMATIEMMTLHTAAVARGLGSQFLIADLPFLCHRSSRSETTHHVKCLLQAGAHAIKIEGGDEDSCNTIRYLTDAGIAILGHIGLTPQSVHQLGGYRVQGKDPEQAAALAQQAIALEKAGCIAVVLECIPAQIAKNITQQLTIPTIGIGAGVETDGQVLVWHDMLGLQDEFMPKFLKQFAHSKSIMLSAINTYAEQVTKAAFPEDIHAF